MPRPFLINLPLLYDGCALVSKEKYQYFRIQFEYRRFRHNNDLALSFRKVLSSKSDKVTELAEGACTEVLDKEFVDVFALSVQDLAASKFAAELNVENVECNVHQVVSNAK